MRPLPIPDEIVWDGAGRIVVAAPDGDLTNTPIGAVEALCDYAELSDGQQVRMAPRYCMRIGLDPGDLERLQNGEDLWLCLYTLQMPVWSLGFGDGDLDTPTTEGTAP